ncbi:hypothetical protein [Zavarzinella formosa]|uniref:hypothetical protein n=1 Tax=Zavarzinella formosa TaxID=360055 RepID=UPI000372F8DF|nr:hypothetical protein [Zavarzinella formosa]
MQQSDTLPDSIRQPDDARSLVSWCIATIGPGYHPDTEAGDYVDANGNDLFQKSEGDRLDKLHEEAFGKGFGELMYEHGLTLQRAALAFPPLDENEGGK